MIQAKIEINQEELSILREIMMANPINVKKRKRSRIIFASMAIVMAIYTIVHFLNHSSGNSLLALTLTVFFTWAATSGVVFYQNFIIKKQQNKANDKLKSGGREYNFDIDGVTILSEIGWGLNKWEAFKCWGIFKEYVYLKRIDNQMLLVKRTDLPKEDYEALLSLLNTNLVQENLTVKKGTGL